MSPSYKELSEKEFENKVDKGKAILKSCELCGWKCGVNRLKGEKGMCGAGKKILFHSARPHMGEEDFLVGNNGSGTVFLSKCSISCVFCQNYEISQKGVGKEVEPEYVAEKMVELQEEGCHNINLVSPTHFGSQLVEAVYKAVKKGLEIPIVYNTGGYDSLEVLRLFDGIVDVYLPDMKYGSNQNGLKYSRASGYWDVNRKAVRMMQYQVGDLKLNEEGLAEKGMIIRHLVLPNGLGVTGKILEFIRNEVSEDAYVNIMDQYHPCWKAVNHELLGRRITEEEYGKALDKARKLGLENAF